VAILKNLKSEDEGTISRASRIIGRATFDEYATKLQQLTEKAVADLVMLKDGEEEFDEATWELTDLGITLRELSGVRPVVNHDLVKRRVKILEADVLTVSPSGMVICYYQDL
jgi:hypothetical protein